MKSNQTGIAHIIAIVTVVVISVIGLVGWRILRAPSRQSNIISTSSPSKAKTIGQDALNGLTEEEKSSDETDIKIKDISEIAGESEPDTVTKGDAKVQVYVVGPDGSKYRGIYNLMFVPENNKRSVSIGVAVEVSGISIGDCTISQKYVPDDNPTNVQSNNLKSVEKQQIDANDGDHIFTAKCLGKGQKLEASFGVRIADQYPKLCRDFNFDNSASVSVDSLSSLKTALTGKWEGCVDTPWVPDYYVSMQFKSDNTYTAVTNEILDGVEMNAMYYGIQDNSPLKKFSINSFQSQLGSGNIDIFFGSSNTTQDSLQNIRLMGDKLSFDMYHRGYGPLSFKLFRK